MKKRAYLVVMDSVGCGGAPDAEAFGDLGANTLGHIAEACENGLAETGRSGPLHIPNLRRMGALQSVNLATGKMVNSDSVFQIAAHEDVFRLERLLTLCEHLSDELHAMKVGRVIARPFVGKSGDYSRTRNRKDFAMNLPVPGLMDWANADGRDVHGIGKIGDIFSGSGVDTTVKGRDYELMEYLKRSVSDASDGSLTFANFVEFDSEYGHRRDVSGYARHLEWFDKELTSIIGALRPEDLLILTADHGNDPTWHGTEHTRERVPVLSPFAKNKEIGLVNFVDVAASVADHLELSQSGPGRSFL